jgi:hypothetical protein
MQDGMAEGVAGGQSLTCRHALPEQAAAEMEQRGDMPAARPNAASGARFGAPARLGAAATLGAAAGAAAVASTSRASAAKGARVRLACLRLSICGASLQCTALPWVQNEQRH